MSIDYGNNLEQFWYQTTKIMGHLTISIEKNTTFFFALGNKINNIGPYNLKF